MMRYNKGAAIVVTVMILAMVAVLCSIALKSSIFSSQMTTHATIDKVLETEAEVAMFHVTSPLNAANKKSATGMFGVAKANANYEIVWCMPAAIDGVTTFFNSATFSKMKLMPTGPVGTDGAATGYCQVNNAGTHFTSSRKKTLAQVSLKYMPTMTATVLSEGAVTTGDVYLATVTALLPHGSLATETEINNCLSKKINNFNGLSTNANSNVNVNTCLRDLGVPTYTTTATFIY